MHNQSCIFCMRLNEAFMMCALILMDALAQVESIYWKYATPYGGSSIDTSGFQYAV